MAGLIPQSFLEELLNRTDLVELIDGYVPLKKQGSSLVACCPFHNEKTPSFHVIAAKQYYYCFGCGASGNAISFAMEYLHQDFVQSVETLATRLGLEVPRDGQTKKQAPTKDLYQLLNNVSEFYQNLLKTKGKKAIEYLRQRGLSGAIAKQYQLGYSNPAWHDLEQHFNHDIKHLITTGMLIHRDDGKQYDRYRDRIMFPIHDRNGRVIGFGGRALTPEQEPKYLNSPETIIFQKNRELYGLHQAIQTNKELDYILVVEGYMDVIALAQHGIANTVATLGTATSTYHIKLLSRHTKRIVFAFDGDNAGKKAAWRALESSISSLNDGLDIVFIFLPEGHDPDSLIREKGQAYFETLIEHATPLNRYFFDTMSESINTQTIAGRTGLINAVKPYIARMEDGPYKQLLLEELTRITRIDYTRIEQLMQTEPPTTQSHSSQITRTPKRIVVVLLLQNPEICMQTLEKLPQVVIDTLPDPLIKTLINQIRNNPEIKTSMLLELWRDKPEFEALLKLAGWNHQVPQHALEHEFIDTILFLAKQQTESKINQLIQKARTQSLSEIERMELQTLLKDRHKQTSTPSA